MWALYKIENYVLESIDDINALLNQTKYQQTIMPYNNPRELDGIKAVSNLTALLDKKSNIDILK